MTEKLKYKDVDIEFIDFDKPSDKVCFAKTQNKSVDISFNEWWDNNSEQYLKDSSHMSEYHMASVVWKASSECKDELITSLLNEIAYQADNR